MASEESVLGPITLPRSLANKARSATASVGVAKDQSINRPFDPLNSNIAVLRATGRTSEAIRKLYHKDGTVSSGVVSLVQVANSGYKVAAYNRVTGRFDSEGTRLVNAIVQGMDTLFDYSQGFSTKQTMASCISVALKETVIDGACAGELVLDKYRLPEKIQLVPYNSLTFKSNGNGGVYPEQAVSGSDPIPLNIPNFFVSDLLKDIDRTYADSFLEGAANTAIYYNEFIEDMRRSVKRAGHTRLTAVLNTEKVIASAASAGITDPEKVLDYMNIVRDEIVTLLNDIEPEEALVSFDVVEFDAIHAEADKSDYKELLQAIANMTATALKSSPSVLGMRGTGSQSLSNTESLVFIKVAKAIQVPVQDVFSRALTLAVRLFGLDVYCKLVFNDINLRPEDELSAYRSMQEDRVMQKLSLGLMSDDEAAWHLGCFPLDLATFTPLSGTRFHQSNGQDLNTRTNADKKGAQEKANEPDTPTSSGGRDNADRKDKNGS